MQLEDTRVSLQHKESQKQYLSDLVSPTFMMILIPSIIFFTEVLVMIILSAIPPLSTVYEALLDSTLLILFIFPVLYYLIIRPLRFFITNYQECESIHNEYIDELQKANGEIKKLQSLLPLCSKCNGIRNDKDYITEVTDYMKAHPYLTSTGALCSDCE